jgi:hypothetical protein
MVTALEQMIESFAPALIRCGIKVEHYKQEFSGRTLPTLKEALNWLKARQDVIDEYYKVRSLRSEEIWSAYEHMDAHDLREVIMLKDVTRKVKLAFVGRPAALRREKDGSKCKGSGKSA